MKKDNKKEDKEQDIRAFIDLQVAGNAKGGLYMKNKRLHNKIIEIESLGVERVVGIVYDETDKIEFVTKTNEEIHSLQDNKLMN